MFKRVLLLVCLVAVLVVPGAAVMQSHSEYLDTTTDLGPEIKSVSGYLTADFAASPDKFCDATWYLDYPFEGDFSYTSTVSGSGDASSHRGAQTIHVSGPDGLIIVVRIDVQTLKTLVVYDRSWNVKYSENVGTGGYSTSLNLVRTGNSIAVYWGGVA